MRLHRTTAAGTRYAGSFSSKPTAEMLRALDQLADAARKRFLTDPQGTPPAAAPLGTDEHTGTLGDDSELHRPGSGRQLSPEGA